MLVLEASASSLLPYKSPEKTQRKSIETEELMRFVAFYCDTVSFEMVVPTLFLPYKEHVLC